MNGPRSLSKYWLMFVGYWPRYPDDDPRLLRQLRAENSVTVDHFVEGPDGQEMVRTPPGVRAVLRVLCDADADDDDEKKKKSHHARFLGGVWDTPHGPFYFASLAGATGDPEEHPDDPFAPRRRSSARQGRPSGVPGRARGSARFASRARYRSPWPPSRSRSPCRRSCGPSAPSTARWRSSRPCWRAATHRPERSFCDTPTSMPSYAA